LKTKHCTCREGKPDPLCPVGEVVGPHAPPNPFERRLLPDRRRPHWEVLEVPVPIEFLSGKLGIAHGQLPAGLLLLVSGDGARHVFVVGNVNLFGGGGACDGCASPAVVLAISHDLVPLAQALGTAACGSVEATP
jgi:hypothetical protein